MASSTIIEHKGTIESIDRGKLNVRFTSISACGECHAKSHCHVADMKDKEVQVENSNGAYHVGEEVNIVMTPAQGFEALGIGYVYPFLLVFASLVILILSGMGELYSGLFSLSLLLPYYLIVYWQRNKLNKKFQFTLRKLE